MNWSQEFLSFFPWVQYLKERVFLGSKLLFFLDFPKLFISVLYDWYIFKLDIDIIISAKIENSEQLMTEIATKE